MSTNYSPRVEALIAHAMGYPETTLESPWDFPLVKVRGKIFCMFHDEPGTFTVTLKLRDSLVAAMDRDNIAPASHGLGKSGWVTSTWLRSAPFDDMLIHAWMDESFRLVAPKKLSAQVPVP